MTYRPRRKPDPRRARGHRILDQSWREDGPPPRPPLPALERLHAAIAVRATTQLRAAEALGVPRDELWEWLFGSRWEPTDATRRAIHEYLEVLDRG